jgi:glutamate---cysteine ligase / carboxylate-amine ligase
VLIYTFGIEEEFFVVSPATRNAVSRVPKALLESAQARLGAERVGQEMLQSQIETISPVFEDMDEARVEMTRLRRGLIAAAAEHDLNVFAAGTHPLSAWHSQSPTEKPRYTRLMDDFQIVGRRNLLCGMHVHVGVRDDVDRVALMNRLMRWLPLFLALSTSSPFWNRDRTGLLSYRQAAYDEWPRTGIPDFFESQQDYDAFVDLLVTTGSIDGAGSLWWAIRPSAQYPTLELRIADCCTDLDDALAIAALFRCIVRAHVRRPTLGRTHTEMSRRVIDENRWRAKRYGIDAEFIDEHRRAAFPFRGVLSELRTLVAEDAKALGCERELAHLDVILRRGTSAHRQLARYRARSDAGATRLEALRDVVDWLIEATVPHAGAARRGGRH